MFFLRVIIGLFVVFQVVFDVQCMDESGQSHSFDTSYSFSDAEKETIQLTRDNIPLVLAKGSRILGIDVEKEIRACVENVNNTESMVQEFSESEEFESAQDLAVVDESSEAIKKIMKRRMSSSECSAISSIIAYQKVFDTVIDSLELKIVEGTAPAFIDGFLKVMRQQVADVDSIKDEKFVFVTKHAPLEWYRKEIGIRSKNYLNRDYFHKDYLNRNSFSVDSFDQDHFLSFIVEELGSERDKKRLEAKKEATRLMFDFGFNPHHVVDKQRNTFLMYAINSNCLPLIEIVLSYGVDVNKPDNKGVDPLLKIVACDHVWGDKAKAAKLLINAGAKLDGLYDNNKYNLLDKAVRSNCPSVSVVNVLLQAGVEKNGTDISGETPLHVAAGINGGEKIVAALLQYGADVDPQDSTGSTPLHRVFDTYAYRSAGRSAALLINAGANEKVLNNHGHSPIEMCYNLGSASACNRSIERSNIFLAAIQNRNNQQSSQAVAVEDAVDIVQDVNKDVSSFVESRKRKRE